MKALFIIVVLLVSCRSDEGGRPAPGDSSVTHAQQPPPIPLDTFTFSSKPHSRLSLPPALREVSGIAFSDDGRLFAHNDERGTMYQLDPATGKLLKQFAVGERRLMEDFEDMAIVGDTFYLVNSKGDLFAFREGRDRENVPFELQTTGLSSRNDVEGLCYDPSTGCLLLACKAWPGRDSGKTRAVYAFDLGTGKLLATPRFLIDLDELKKRFMLKDFRPSGIARHPPTGNFFVISAVGNSIIEISPSGKVLSCAELPKKYHEQPEGIAFDGKGSLYVANEGPGKGKIVVYADAEH